jgi:hypothetical protein
MSKRGILAPRNIARARVFLPISIPFGGPCSGPGIPSWGGFHGEAARLLGYGVTAGIGKGIAFYVLSLGKSRGANYPRGQPPALGTRSS